MATYIQLDQAAHEVKKSEITIRRLIKAGKVSHKKEKTLTGFIYLVDPEEILRFYEGAPAVTEQDGQEEEVAEPGKVPESEEAPSRQIRVAVTGESGNLSEYWQKRAETYEDRYYRELDKQAQLREELGTWRGRAEQAQNMLVKLLPAPTAAQPAESTVSQQSQGFPTWFMGGLIVVMGAIVVFAGIVAYFILVR